MISNKERMRRACIAMGYGTIYNNDWFVVRALEFLKDKNINVTLDIDRSESSQYELILNLYTSSQAAFKSNNLIDILSEAILNYEEDNPI